MPDSTTTKLDPEDPLFHRIRDYLSQCRELNQLCSQSGWIDNDTLQFDVEWCDGAETRVAVHFTEVIMEGAGCVADRKERFGKLIITFDPAGAVHSCRLV